VADPVSQVMGLAAAPVDVPAANLAEGLGAQTLKAYHGSPHDFDQFSLSKIGTGEGAQAYGHGLYFAEKEGIAADYRNKLVQDRHVELDAWDPDLGYGAKDPKTNDIKWFSNEKDAKDFKRDLMGKMYQVNLHASPDELLDWDKPLSQQSPKVQEALKDYKLPDYVRGDQIVDMLKNRAMSAQEPAARQALHQYAPDATFELQRNGIKGIQYLDQGSRTTGQVVSLHGKYYFSGSSVPYESFEAAEKAAEAMAPRTRNFVIFDDKIIEIAKKYGVALPVAAEIARRQQIGAKNGNVESSVAP
jgi:hypothetical protein